MDLSTVATFEISSAKDSLHNVTMTGASNTVEQSQGRSTVQVPDGPLIGGCKESEDDVNPVGGPVETNGGWPPSPSTSRADWIDNSHKVYIPLRLSCGLVVQCRPEVLVHCPLVLQDLNSDV